MLRGYKNLIRGEIQGSMKRIMNVHMFKSVMLSPHIDDIPLSLGAALLDGRFPDTMVVNIFSISKSAYDKGDMECITNVRRLEDKEFFRNVPHDVELIYLDRLDAPLRLDITEDDVCVIAPPSDDSVEVSHIRSFLDGIRPDRILLVAPLALGQHVDHVVVHQAACAAAIDGWQVAFYEDAPYAFDLTLNEIQRAVTETSNNIGHDLKKCILPFEQAGLSKEETIAVYRSQIGRKSIDCIRKHENRLGGAVERIWMTSVE